MVRDGYERIAAQEAQEEKEHEEAVSRSVNYTVYDIIQQANTNEAAAN